MPQPLRPRFFWPGALGVIAVIGASVAMLVPKLAPPGESPGGQAAFFDDLLKVYTPRKACMFHEQGVVWLHFVSDLLIGIAYFSIPVALVYFVRNRRDLAFHWVFWLFAAFILACGTTHFVGVWDLWQPLYKIDGLVKAATAALSVATAIILWPLIPKALALPSPAQLEERVVERTRELARANTELEAARLDAERANRMKDEFLATLSHELRTPLQAVLGWALVLQGTKSPEQVEEGLSIITRNAQAQKKLIEDLLDMSRIASGKMRLETQDFDLADVVASAVGAVKPGAAAKALTIATSVAAAAVRGDPARLQQVVWNLLSNAVKFTPRGGRIDVRLEASGEQVTLRVTDTGEGIEPDFLGLLFQRFSQGDSTPSRRHGGLGIGLALVRHIVELHGGTVTAHSDGRGKGASFLVTLPGRDEATRATSRSLQDAVPTVAALAGVEVLGVDDDPDARLLMERVLRDAGAIVRTAASAAEVIESLKDRLPRVLLCDLALPGHDGFEIIRHVRSLPANQGGAISAIAVTAFAGPEHRARCADAGFQSHLAKPYQPEDLVAAILGVLRRP